MAKLFMNTLNFLKQLQPSPKEQVARVFNSRARCVYVYYMEPTAKNFLYIVYNSYKLFKWLSYCEFTNNR